MTKAEAIAMLKRIQEPEPEAWEPQINKAAFEALGMAIKALEQQPCEDTISRQQAIDALIKWYGCEPSDIGAFENIIEKMPSAQPDIIRCKDCKFYAAMSRKTKSGICSLIMHQNFGDDWYCADAERRTDG